MFALLVFVIAVVGLVTWRILDSKKANDLSNAPVDQKLVLKNHQEAEDRCNNELNDKVFCKFIGHFDLNNTAFQIDLSGNGNGLEPGTIVADGKGNVSGPDEVLLNGSYYVRLPSEYPGSHKWTKYPPGTKGGPTKPSDMIDVSINPEDLNGQFNDLSYKMLGKEPCGNLSCFKYQIVSNYNPIIEQYVWFDDNYYLLRHFNSKTPDGTADMKFTYNKSAVIKAPK
jgi:hypothetical protein